MINPRVNPVEFKKHIEILHQEFGIPIWITEFDWNEEVFKNY